MFYDALNYVCGVREYITSHIKQYINILYYEYIYKTEQYYIADKTEYITENDAKTN